MVGDRKQVVGWTLYFFFWLIRDCGVIIFHAAEDSKITEIVHNNTALILSKTASY